MRVGANNAAFVRAAREFILTHVGRPNTEGELHVSHSDALAGRPSVVYYVLIRAFYEMCDEYHKRKCSSWEDVSVGSFAYLLSHFVGNDMLSVRFSLHIRDHLQFMSKRTFFEGGVWGLRNGWALIHKSNKMQFRHLESFKVSRGRKTCLTVCRFLFLDMSQDIGGTC